MESVKLRLNRNQPFSFLEFNYMLLQSYDFLYLNENYGCNMQFGGSDQWGNIIMGCDLISKILKKQVFGITTPLVTTASGAKMGKSANGAIWLNENNLNPYEYYQYWRNIDDADVIKFAKLYSEFNQAEFKDFEELFKNNINEAKKHLAYKMTEICHGTEKADKALDTATKIFEQNKSSDNLESYDIEKNIIEDGFLISDALVYSNLCKSKSDAKRLIRSGAVKINNIKICYHVAVIFLHTSKCTLG